MSAVAEQKLSLEDFHARYDGEKPYFEYWDGEAVRKSVPTRLHSLVQKILLILLDAMGFESGAEVTLKLNSAYEPIPDVIAADSIGDPYPTEAFEVAIEILSPKDPFSRVTEKCRLYNQWGIRQIVVIDPLTREIRRFDNGSLRLTDTIAQRGDRILTASELWQQVDLRLSKK
jgi:Uma2 family endonuclease